MSTRVAPAVAVYGRREAAILGYPLDLTINRTMLVLLAALVAAFMLGDIARLPMQLWDESRLAVNAAEMLVTGNHLVTTYGFQPDLWNTKPPLLINLIAGSIDLFGFNTFALRLPSALAALGTVVLVAAFARNVTGSLGWGLAAGVLLAASPAFYGVHAGQTGDYDSLLTLLTTGYAVTLFVLLESDRPRPMLAVATGVLIGLAVLTKGIAGVIPGVGVAAYAVMFAPRRLWTGVREFAAVIAVAVVIAGGFYWLRGAADPAYLKAVAENDLGGRFSVVQDQHHGSPLRYVMWLMERAPGGIWPRFAGAGALGLAAAAPFLLQGRARRAAFFALFQAGAILAVFSCAATKLPWYLVPALPMLSVALALGGQGMLQRIERDRPARLPLASAIVGMLMAVVIGQAVIGRYIIVDSQPTAPRAFDQLASAAQRLHAAPLAVVDHGYPNAAGFVGYAPTLRYYALGATHEGAPIKSVYTLASASASKYVGSCDPATYAAVSFSGRVVWGDHDCVIVQR